MGCASSTNKEDSTPSPPRPAAPQPPQQQPTAVPQTVFPAQQHKAQQQARSEDPHLEQIPAQQAGVEESKADVSDIKVAFPGPSNAAASPFSEANGKPAVHLPAAQPALPPSPPGQPPTPQQELPGPPTAPAASVAPREPEATQNTFVGPADSTTGQELGGLSELASSANSSSDTKLQHCGFQTMAPSRLANEVSHLSWVGHGGYGAVYKGVWQGANVAVKFTVTDYLDQGAAAHEAVLSKLLSHPNVVQTYASRVALLEEDFLREVFEDGQFPSRDQPQESFHSGDGFGSPYGANATMKFKDVMTHIGARPGHYMTQIIMEYCDRGSLHQAIAKGLFKSSTKWNNKIALRALLRTAREIAQGMSHLHACRVVHGDLKPGNVLLMSSRADRRGFTAKVSDFGLSTYCMASHISVTRWSTVSYMAPEAFEGHLTMGSDTYSFGVLIWEMVTAQQPYAGMQAAQIVMGVQAGLLKLEWPPDCEPRVVELVEQCIQKDASQRPGFLQLINDLTTLEAQVRVESRNPADQLSMSVASGALPPPTPPASQSVGASAVIAANGGGTPVTKDAEMPALMPPQPPVTRVM